MKRRIELKKILHEMTLSPEDFKRYFIASRVYLQTFLKWVLIAAVTGVIGGVIGSLFHMSVEYANEFFTKYAFLLYLLPVSGIIIVFLYKITNMSKNTGTNHVINSVRTDGKVPAVMAPLIFVSTFLTHLCGGSAGREGAALQLGGSIGAFVGRVFHLDEKDMHLTVMCGMSALFSALFGTPLTASVFAMEVISVGIFYYSGLIPCIMSAVTAFAVSLAFNMTPTAFVLPVVPELSVLMLLKVILIAAAGALISVVFCIAIKGTEHIMHRHISNAYIRAVVGGVIIIGLTLAVGSRDYNGAGMGVIENAIHHGIVKPEAFIMKLIFTSVTIAAGFRGGEIVPTFFIGSTMGCLLGQIIHVNPGFAAAVGLIATFCGIVNCPIAAIILSVELFGAEGLLYFGIACGVSYMLSGYYSLYTSQKIVYSKLRAEYVNKNAK